MVYTAHKEGAFELSLRGHLERRRGQRGTDALRQHQPSHHQIIHHHATQQSVLAVFDQRCEGLKGSLSHMMPPRPGIKLHFSIAQMYASPYLSYEALLKGCSWRRVK